jgi:hypothetical protein
LLDESGQLVLQGCNGRRPCYLRGTLQHTPRQDPFSNDPDKSEPETKFQGWDMSHKTRKSKAATTPWRANSPSSSKGLRPCRAQGHAPPVLVPPARGHRCLREGLRTGMPKSRRGFVPGWSIDSQQDTLQHSSKSVAGHAVAAFQKLLIFPPGNCSTPADMEANTASLPCGYPLVEHKRDLLGRIFQTRTRPRSDRGSMRMMMMAPSSFGCAA